MIPNKTYVKFYKRIYNGEQNIYLDYKGEIVEKNKTFYWQNDYVVNRIWERIQLVYKECKGVKENDIFGKNGLISKLLPLQEQYNRVYNNSMNLLERFNSPIVLIEDGSVDVDDLEENGLAPGKVLVYKQGYRSPNRHRPENLKEAIDAHTEFLERIERDMRLITCAFIEKFKSNEV